MQGKIISISTNGDLSAEDTTDPALFERLREIVGGWIELVPLFETIVINGERVPCVAFCNEEGKLDGLELNTVATAMWRKSAGGDIDDMLFGPVAVVIGDEEFLESV